MVSTGGSLSSSHAHASSSAVGKKMAETEASKGLPDTKDELMSLDTTGSSLVRSDCWVTSVVGAVQSDPLGHSEPPKMMSSNDDDDELAGIRRLRFEPLSDTFGENLGQELIRVSSGSSGTSAAIIRLSWRQWRDQERRNCNNFGKLCSDTLLAWLHERVIARKWCSQAFLSNRKERKAYRRRYRQRKLLRVLMRANGAVSVDRERRRFKSDFHRCDFSFLISAARSLGNARAWPVCRPVMSCGTKSNER